ncbi:MAG: hypothetical protein AB7T06_11785 [Kofleriaceae bacterium]
MSTASELTTLVETEARLDAAVASARIAAEATRAAARERARVALEELEQAIEARRARTEQAIADETRDREQASERCAHDEIARFDAVRGERLDAIAQELARRLVAIAMEEP